MSVDKTPSLSAKIQRNLTQRVGYLLPYLILALTWFGVEVGGSAVWLGVTVTFLLLPILEWLVPLSIPTTQKQDLYFDLLVYLPLPLLTGFLIRTAVLIHHHHPLSSFELIGMIFSAGALTGPLAINVAHELVHRRTQWERAIGQGLLTLVNFPHWGIEHVKGHHKNAGTEEDFATARRHESLYHFWLRNYWGGLRESWNIEKERVKERKHPFLFHRMILFYFLQLVLVVCCQCFLGTQATVFWLGQSGVAILLLITVDYIEHYGLLRKKDPRSGRYEPFGYEHSWDSDSSWSHWALFNLALHSHHHMRPGLAYPALRPQKQSHHLPMGYAGMVILAFFPPFYRRIMDKLI